MGSGGYHKQLQQDGFENSLQVPSCICRCLNTFRNLATSPLLKMFKKRNQGRVKGIRKTNSVCHWQHERKTPTFLMIRVEKTANNKYHDSCPSLQLENGAEMGLGTCRFLFHLQWTVQWRAPLYPRCPRMDGWSNIVLSDKEICSTFLLQDFNVILYIQRIQMTRMNGSSQPHGLIFWWNDALAHPSHCSAVKRTPNSGRWVCFSFTVFKKKQGGDGKSICPQA